MDVTDRWWATVGAGVVLVVLAVLADQPLLVIGAAGLGGWLLVTAGYATREFTRLQQQCTITCTLPIADAFVDTTTTATLRVSRPASVATLPIDIYANAPLGLDIDAESSRVSVPMGETDAETAFSVEFPIVGRFAFPAPTVEMYGPSGLYREQIDHGTAPTVMIRPRTPTLHVGRGGDQAQSVYGQHPTDRSGPGITTRELRQYTPGDDIQAIDWKATARLGETYVRETEGETDRQLLLVVDHRDRMSLGRDGETMLEYAREVGLGIADGAAAIDDPLGLWTVGDHGITTTVPPNTTARTYTQIKTSLYDLLPTNDAGTPVTRTANNARQIADRLEGDTDSFGQTVAAYLDETQPYVRRIRDDPLVETIREVRTRHGSEGWITIITDDTDPTRLREAVKIATRGGSYAMVFITPQCLFEPTTLTDLDDAYDRYLAFEELRRELDGAPRVTAFEVAPGDRLDAVLAHRQARRPTTP